MTDLHCPKILPPTVPLFEQRVTATLKKCTDTFRSRGDQYGDTWRDCQHLALKAALFQMFGLKPTKLQCEALSAGVLYDVKYQRLEGGYDPDHPIDGINYAAYFHDAMAEVYKEAGSKRTGDDPTALRDYLAAPEEFLN